MKILFSILALVFMTKECDQKNSEKQSSKTEILNNQETEKQQDQVYTIKYSAMSRGIFKEITINNETISVQKSRNSKPEIQPIKEDLWREIVANIEPIDLESLEKLEAPTGKRLYDAAAHATLKISVDGKTYSTSSFDHGFPPKDIEGICGILYKLIED
jgi:hypothetical protein